MARRKDRILFYDRNFDDQLSMAMRNAYQYLWKGNKVDVNYEESWSDRDTKTPKEEQRILQLRRRIERGRHNPFSKSGHLLHLRISTQTFKTMMNATRPIKINSNFLFLSTA